MTKTQTHTSYNLTQIRYTNTIKGDYISIFIPLPGTHLDTSRCLFRCYFSKLHNKINGGHLSDKKCNVKTEDHSNPNMRQAY